MRYSPSLDGIRALAALVVVAFHAKVPGFSGGFLGVDVFFVLSGYLITSLIRESYCKQSFSLLDFYRRRSFRLYPPFLILLTVYVIVAPFAFPCLDFERHLRDALLSGLYLADYARTWGMPLAVLNHTWSLAIEAQFYFVWPFIVIALCRVPPQTAVTALFVLFLVATTWRWWGYFNFRDPWLIYDRADTHCSGLILGALVAFSCWRAPRGAGVVGLLCIALCVFSSKWRAFDTAVIGFTAAELATALVIIAQPAWLGGALVAWLGKMSYGLYLWHYPVIRWMRSEAWDWPEIFLGGLVFGLTCSALSFYYVESRFRRPRLSLATHITLAQNVK